MIELHTKIDSDEFILEGLNQFLGKDVEITISENFVTTKFANFFGLANEIETEEDYIQNLREQSLI
jgi:hypothetical protein